MALNLPDAPELVTPGDLGDELASFVRAMRANNMSPNTILAYGGAVRQFGRWLLANDQPTTVARIEPRHIVLQGCPPASSGHRHAPETPTSRPAVYSVPVRGAPLCRSS